MAPLPDPKRLQELSRKFLQGTITDSEQKELDDWFLAQPELLDFPKQVEVSEDEHRQAIFARIQNEIKGNPQPKIRTLWPRIAAAASILLLLSAGGYFFLHKKPIPQQVAQNTQVVPGGKKAVLILSNGQQINLADAHAGALAQQGQALITKSPNGQIVYSKQNGTRSNAILYNTIVTPRGGYYPLQMADGTLAILDAGSSIKYPVNFKDGQDRLVEVTGQVYFEVKHNPQQPFKIKAKGQTIEDIGTKFNINAYTDEPAIRTTLIEGSIKVQDIILKPGQQSDGITLRKVNMDDVIAWKNGQTSFEGESVQEIMRQVSRWYDVDVVYEGTLPQRQFTGGIPRNAAINDLIKALEFEEIHVSLQGKKLIVRP